MGEAFSGPFKGTACGKIILLGEHAVVHGFPAIAVGIPLGAEAHVEPAISGPSALDIKGVPTPLPETESVQQQAALDAIAQACGVLHPVRARVSLQIPVRAGLGSSAAIGVAIARALFASRSESPELSKLLHAAAQWERTFHGNPSGIDVAAAALGGALSFQRDSGPSPLPLGGTVPLCVAPSGMRPATRTMVEKVARFARRKGGLGQQIFQEIGELVRSAQTALGRGDLNTLGKLLDMNHLLLSSLSVTTDLLDSLCSTARRAGALGAKMTGAGGGGCVIALTPGCEEAVLEAWAALGIKGFCTLIGAESA